MTQEKRVKLRIGRDFHSEQSTMAVDRLSTLPTPLIHHILSFIPTLEVVRMSLLSRRWRGMWRSVPALYFCDTKSGSKEWKFSAAVETCLSERRRDILNLSDTNVTRFKLDMKCYTMDIDFWLTVMLLGSLKELDLCIRTVSSRKAYTFPLGTSSLRSLTLVKLCGVTLDHLTPINLPNLISLTLENVEMDDEVLHNLLLGCCSLEKLLLKECVNLVNPRVLNSSLRFLKIVYESTKTSFPERTLHVEARNLQSFAYSGALCSTNLSLSSCGILRQLSLSNVRLHDWWLKDLICGQLFIESLSLLNCKFDLAKGNKNDHASETTIDAPNPVSIGFEGGFLFTFSTVTPKISQADVEFHNPITFGKQWYSNLLEFLRCLDRSKSVHLGICSEEALIFPSEFRRNCHAPLPTLKHLHLTIRTDQPLLRESELRDAFHWASPSLETLSIEQVGHC